MKTCFTVRLTTSFTLFLLMAMNRPLARTGSAAEAGVGPDLAAKCVNSLGLDLLVKGTKPAGNALLSPYSIQSALAMTFAGADGATRIEMAKTLHYPADEPALHRSFTSLYQALEEVRRGTEEDVRNAKKSGGPSEPVTLTVANRLFGQRGYEFRAPFLDLVKRTYGAPFEMMDFVRDSAGATREINRWVEERTRERIRDLIPRDALDGSTRLVLVNAIYLKAPWAEEFPAHATKPEGFHVGGGAEAKVPTMTRRAQMGYAQLDGFSVVTVPYSGGDVQLLILLPDQANGLPAVESKVTPEVLLAHRNPPRTDVILHLPKLRLEPPLLRLGAMLRRLGMKSAFDEPRGSANFDRMAPRRPDDYLFISEVFHKTFLTLDEKGTEAAAATAVTMMRATAMIGQKPPPIEVRVDRPFLFAIQHRPSGACLFLGRVTDPR